MQRCVTSVRILCQQRPFALPTGLAPTFSVACHSRSRQSVVPLKITGESCWVRSNKMLNFIKLGEFLVSVCRGAPEYSGSQTVHTS